MGAFEEFRRPQICVGIAVRRLRIARSLTQEELSGRCGLHATYISDVERGRRNLGWTALANLVEGLSSTLEEFGSVYDAVFEQDCSERDQRTEQEAAKQALPRSAASREAVA